MTQHTLKIEELTLANAEPYGTLISPADRTPTYHSPEFDYWEELAIGEAGAAISVGMVSARPQQLVAATFERHTRTAELLAPLDGDVILVLGKPTDGPLPEVGGVRAFRLPAGTAILLRPGTWHYAPMVADTPVNVLVVFRKGTSNDDKELHCIDEELGVVFTVTE